VARVGRTCPGRYISRALTLGEATAEESFAALASRKHDKDEEAAVSGSGLISCGIDSTDPYQRTAGWFDSNLNREKAAKLVTYDFGGMCHASSNRHQI
jgi:hypothetical protein